MFWSGTWPKLQALNDLKALAQARLGQAPFLSELDERGRAGLAALMRQTIDSRDLKLEPEGDYLELLSALEEASYSDNRECATFALALLLADAIHGQCGHSGEDFGWLEHRAMIEGLPKPWGATLARGYALALDANNRDNVARPSQRHFVSEHRDEIIPPLVALARRLDEGMIESVAQADYGWRSEEHAKALRAVLKDERCRFPSGDRWCPAEVVELTGHDPKAGAAFLPCIALLVLDDIHTSGNYDQMTFRWMNNADVFLKAPLEFLDPILRGIRHVMERDWPDDWDPYFDWPAKKIEAQARFVPWFDRAIKE